MSFSPSELFYGGLGAVFAGTIVVGVAVGEMRRYLKEIGEYERVLQSTFPANNPRQLADEFARFYSRMGPKRWPLVVYWSGVAMVVLGMVSFAYGLHREALSR